MAILSHQVKQRFSNCVPWNPRFSYTQSFQGNVNFFLNLMQITLADTTPVASLGLVSPGAVTHDVTPIKKIFLKKINF